MFKKAYENQSGTICYWVSDSHDPNQPWLVFLPGLTADHRLFDKQIEHFEPRANCFVWDPPAHAQSRPYSEVSLLNWATALFEIMQCEGIERPILIGQSMGGYVSQMFLDEFPGVAAGFVSIDSCPLQRKHYSGWELWLLKRMRLTYKSIPWKMLVHWGSTGVADTEYGQQLMRAMMLDYEKADYVDLTARGYKALAEAVEENRAYDITCPALLLCGENDAAGSAKHYNKEWAAQSELPFVWVKNAGHNSNCDQPEFVNTQIAAFVEDLCSRKL